MSFNIVLVEPEIPQNTGNIARTCACTGSSLHLVYPLKFEIDDKKLKRAGLDYWHSLDIHYHDSIDAFMEYAKDFDVFYTSSSAKVSYTDVKYPDNAFLVFGKETAGLPRELLKKNSDRTIRIPMINGQRCLNLSNAVAVVLYEALRQNNFLSLI